MLNKLRAHWHAHNSRFAEALSHERYGIHQDRHLWAHYRLGMYETVANSDIAGEQWRGLFAKAVSLASCGRHTEAEKVTLRYKACADCRPHISELADALAPLMPDLALSLLENTNAPTPLHAALLLRVGKLQEARTLLEEAFEHGEQKKFPELYLYHSNAFEEYAPEEKLAMLNAFLEAYRLPPLKLKDPALPPSPINIETEVPCENFDGPLVTVLMTTYRTGHRTDTAIGSLLSQSYRNLELIVVDDASGDDTPSIVQKWADKDKRVTFIPLTKNVGTYLAKTVGLKQAKGEFVTCHDSDDWSHPQKIERQVIPLLKDPKLIATTSLWVRMQDDGAYYARPVHPLMRLNPSSPLFRRKEVLEHAGGWDLVRTGADSEFIARLRLVFGKRAVKRIAQPLSLGSHRADSLMTAADTGHSDTGISPIRLAYWEAWNAWHISELRAGRKPFMPSDLPRPFEAPESILVPPSDIKASLLSPEQ